MIKLGWILTIYICLSFILFLTISFTIDGWIIYLLLLLPFYLVVLLTSWFFIIQNHDKTGQIKYWIWSIVLALQALTILASPGNCYGTKQGARCYSNLQILLSDVPRTGPSSAPHWVLIENAFLGFLAAYGLALVISILSTSVESRY